MKTSGHPNLFHSEVPSPMHDMTGLIIMSVGVARKKEKKWIFRDG
jgi:hypothetical protein